MGSFIKVIGKQNIRKTMREYMHPDKDRVPFIAAIHSHKGIVWNGHVMKGGLTIEGARPMGASVSCCTNPHCKNGEHYNSDLCNEEVLYSMTNGDSDYRSLIGSIKLSDIAYLELLG